MTPRQWWWVWERCADLYRRRCTAELMFAWQTGDDDRYSECIQAAIRAALMAERAHEHVLDAWIRAGSPLDEETILHTSNTGSQ